MAAADFIRAKRFIEAHTWNFAKTMSSIPHWYCLREEFKDVEEFTWFVDFIRKHSREGQFYTRTYRYFYLGEYKYWDMDPTPESCDLVNRDKFRADFVERGPVCPDSHSEEFLTTAFSLFRQYQQRGKVADVLCGDGKVYSRLSESGKSTYSGIDYRLMHLRKFADEHIEILKNRSAYLNMPMNASFASFDTIVSLNAHLLGPEDIRRIEDSRKQSSAVLLCSERPLPSLSGETSLKLIQHDNAYMYTNI